MNEPILPRNYMLGDILNEETKLKLTLMCSAELLRLLDLRKREKFANGDTFSITFVCNLNIEGGQAVPVMEPT